MSQRFRETGCHARRSGQGRPRCTNQGDDRFKRLQALRNRYFAGNEMKNRIQNARNVTISSNTVRRKINESGLSAKHPAIGSLLTIAHKQAGLEFDRERVDWDLDD
ncbi:hypothetical protein D910_08200 [Dendroctonus ponderosae]|uniref:Transposase Tc1-like domain-containing protein n=1 Tax=Dendroctonus ponderosae TaxID=77166 RepID=U4ULI3_DENPD|nr:hypothetical protein D910_08200 [Dendroctonus ponderosae]